MTDLTTLADRVAAATADEQRELLCDAWDALGPIRKWTDEQARKFSTLVDDEGYVDAALMLVPMPGEVAITPNGDDDGWQAWVWTLDDYPNWHTGNTMALAIATAALRAHASEAAA